MAARTDASQSKEEETFLRAADEIDALFERCPYTFTGEHHATAAESAVREFREVAVDTMRAVRELLDDGGFTPNRYRGLSNIQSAIEQINNPMIFSVEQSANGTSVSGRVPLLRRAGLDQLKDKLKKMGLDRSISAKTGQYFLAKFVTEYQTVLSAQSRELEDAVLVISYGLGLLAARESLRTSVRDQATSQSLAKAVSRADLMVKQSEARLSSLLDQQLAAQQEIHSLSSETDAIRRTVDEYRSEASNALEAFRQQIGLKETQDLWVGEARKGKWAYYISLTVLMLLLLGIPTLAFTFRAEILMIITEIENAAIARTGDTGVLATLSVAARLLLITAPLALIVWGIKLIVRFNMRSMLLMDDATQRVTMLHTYLFLVDKGAATIQDRGALLEAMFRRAPGHGPEAIEPPNLTDIMKYGDTMRGDAKI